VWRADQQEYCSTLSERRCWTHVRWTWAESVARPCRCSWPIGVPSETHVLKCSSCRWNYADDTATSVNVLLWFDCRTGYTNKDMEKYKMTQDKRKPCRSSLAICCSFVFVDVVTLLVLTAKLLFCILNMRIVEFCHRWGLSYQQADVVNMVNMPFRLNFIICPSALIIFLKACSHYLTLLHWSIVNVLSVPSFRLGYVCFF